MCFTPTPDKSQTQVIAPARVHTLLLLLPAAPDPADDCCTCCWERMPAVGGAVAKAWCCDWPTTAMGVTRTKRVHRRLDFACGENSHQTKRM
jgi:hypothetical protein